jgi:hypothetical protein
MSGDDEVGRARALLGCSSKDSLIEGVRALLADLADARAEGERWRAEFLRVEVERLRLEIERMRGKP